MNASELKFRKWIRYVFSGISFTAMAFVFQACYGPAYGTVPDENEDVRIMGTVRSKTTKLPINGIQVAANKGLNFEYSNMDGEFDFYIGRLDSSDDSMIIYFLDVDGPRNGSYANKTINIKSGVKNEIHIDVELDEK